MKLLTDATLNRDATVSRSRRLDFRMKSELSWDRFRRRLRREPAAWRYGGRRWPTSSFCDEQDRDTGGIDDAQFAL
jgi:hypothetical protein